VTLQTLSGDEGPDLPEFDLPPDDPVETLRSWLDAAVEHGVREPSAVALATADADGRPSVRTLLIKAVEPRGLTFTTDATSPKGADLAARPYAAVVFYWREILRQVRVAGSVRRLPAAESDVLFAERPIEAQATTAASAQSKPLDSDEALQRRAEALLATGEAIPRPDSWHGYLLEPDEIEFWQGRTNRLHRRLRYRRHEGAWSAQRLQP